MNQTTDRDSIRVYPNLHSVEQASALQRRLYRTIRETMRAMAGRICGVAKWEAKKLLARHIWLDAEHADALRQRVLELRFPRVDVDLDVDKALIAVLAKLPSTNSDAEFLAGVYRVVKPEVLAALRCYLKQSDPLDDSPSHRAMRGIVRELEEELQEFEALWADMTVGVHASAGGPDKLKLELQQAAVWENWLRDALAAAGGIFGHDTGAQLFERAGFSDRPRYQIAMMPKRDSRWLPAITQVPPRPPATPQEQQIWVAIDHVNELWACELPAALIWHYENLPWALYRNTARWAYDEMRHSMMGERRLQAYGFDVGVDVPMVPDHWMGVGSKRGMEAMLFLVHGLEQGGPKWKQQLKAELWDMGDPYTSQDCDYDWADEAGHIRYGQDWIRTLFPNMTKDQIVTRTQGEVDDWKEWIAEKHRTGKHGYEVFLPRIEAKCAQMPALTHPEFFKPLGSSAATTSYGLNG
jgi:uncharacterized ferritin-like protein (DUF455 family)